MMFLANHLQQLSGNNMRFEESLTIQDIIKKHSAFNNIINLGSGNVEQLKKTKPWVSKNVFDLFKKQKAKILHVDAENFSGVDIVQDLSEPNSLAFCDNLKGSKLFILANVLEHIPKKAHAEFLNKIYSKMKSKDGLMITVPYDYPYHADPIDTMYRPSPSELKKLLPLAWLEGEIVSAGSFKEEFSHMNILKRNKKAPKTIMDFSETE